MGFVCLCDGIRVFVMVKQEYLTLELFLKVVAHWVGVTDDDDDDSRPDPGRQQR
jgi:hypothetical protein